MNIDNVGTGCARATNALADDHIKQHANASQKHEILWRKLSGWFVRGQEENANAALARLTHSTVASEQFAAFTELSHYVGPSFRGEMRWSVSETTPPVFCLGSHDTLSAGDWTEFAQTSPPIGNADIGRLLCALHYNGDNVIASHDLLYTNTFVELRGADSESEDRHAISVSSPALCDALRLLGLLRISSDEIEKVCETVEALTKETTGDGAAASRARDHAKQLAMLMNGSIGEKPREDAQAVLPSHVTYQSSASLHQIATISSADLRAHNVGLRQLDTGDASDYRDIRFEALQLHPKAFASSYDEEKHLSLEHFEGLLGASQNHATLGAFLAGKLIGVVSIKRNTLKKLSHVAMLSGMYVKSEASGRGAGRALVGAAVAHARLQLGLKQLILFVTAPSTSARSLYEKFGFIEIGREPDAICIDDEFHDALQMYLPIT